MSPDDNEVNVTVLRQELPSYLGRVQRGATVRITSRGKVIAELVPPRAPADQVESTRLLLRNTVVKYGEPLEPAVGPDAWDALKK